MLAFKKYLKYFSLLLALLTLSFICYSCSASQRMRQEIAEMGRDTITGIIRGCEAVTLPPAAGTALTTPTACLLVHGFLAARTDFNDLGKRLSEKGFTVRMMRLPGHGTMAPDFAWQPRGALPKAVRAEYDALRAAYPRVCVVGFSMGGSLSTLLAAETKPDKVVLAAPYYGVTYNWKYVLPVETWNMLVSGMLSFVSRPKGWDVVNDPSAIGKYFHYGTVPTAGARELIRLGCEARKPEVLGNISSPVLMLHSPGDGAASFWAARKAFDKIGSPRKEFVTLKTSNHMIFWDWEREEVMRRVTDFLLMD